MRLSKVSIEDMIKHFESENLSLKQERERLKIEVKDLIDENCELIDSLEFIRCENKSLKDYIYLTSIISCLGTVSLKKIK
jgi:hypothetical protein